MSRKKASLMRGSSMRLTRKPGRSWETHVCMPRCLDRAIVAANTCTQASLSFAELILLHYMLVNALAPGHTCAHQNVCAHSMFPKPIPLAAENTLMSMRGHNT